MKPLEIIDDAVKRHNPKFVIALFSGGHDSLTATHIASRHPAFSFAVHINTGIGIEKTRDFVRGTCENWGIELREYRAIDNRKADGTPDPQCYKEIVKEFGFPGPDQHSKMYIRLKQRALEMMLRDLPQKRTERVLLITGVRKQESQRRTSHVKPEQKWGSKYWIAPIWEFSKLSVNEYIADHALQRNPVVDLIHMSGECLCGAYARRETGERDELRQWFPAEAKEIDEIESEVVQSFPWGWDEMPPGWWMPYKNGQEFLEGFAPILCTGCQLRHSNNGMHATPTAAPVIEVDAAQVSNI